MTNDYMSTQPTNQLVVNVNKLWRCFDHTLANAMNADVDAIKVILRIYQRPPDFSQCPLFKRNNTNLANACKISIGRFEVDSNELWRH